MGSSIGGGNIEITEINGTAAKISGKYPAAIINHFDRLGIISHITSILAINQISIKNIGITHNREFEEGALRIEFYEEQPGILARKVLKDHGYTIHTRN